MRILLLVLLWPLLGACQTPDLTFASIPWGSEAAEVERMMTERSFRLLGKPSPYGDHLYAGRFAGYPAVVAARMAGGRVAKFEVAVQAPEERRAAVFRELEGLLARRHGRERGTVRVEGPVDAGAWRDAPLGPPRRSAWSRAGAGGESYLILEDRPELAIVIAFESPAWHREFLRRQVRR